MLWKMLEPQSRHRTEHSGPKNHASSWRVYMFPSGTELCGQLIGDLQNTWQFFFVFFMFWKWGYVKRLYPFSIYMNLNINSVPLALWHIFVTSDFFYVQHFLSLVLQCCGRTVGLFCNLTPPDSLTPQQVKVMTWLSGQHHLTSKLNNSKVIPLCSRLPSRFPKQHCCCASVFRCISKNRWHYHSCSFVVHI